jgi:hypothetical protein
MDFDFLSKTLFFPKQGILVIGDLHIGYENMLRRSGVLIPERQVKDIIQDIKNILEVLKKKKYNLNKIVFIGDIKHAFGFEYEERDEFEEVLEFLGELLPEENIIFIKGNHDTIDYSPNNSMKDFYVQDDIVFIHGHKPVKEALKENIKIIVMGHLHPCVVIKEKKGVKKETYKCFLEGEHKGKKIIVMPSFLDFTEGTAVNDYEEDYIESFSPIPKKDMMKFRIHVIGEKEIYDFGEIRDL